MAGYQETALYYSPANGAKVRKVKGVLVRLGIRIKNITPEQFDDQVGTLAGLEEFPGKSIKSKKSDIDSTGVSDRTADSEILVLCNFTDASLDRLLRELRKSNASVALKAVLTETNCAWSFYELYQEVCREHEAMTGKIKE
ncbi:MAG: DUF3783 domain-containing protein [Lachnospiraceae bacterium]|nr:DUF3783 domain-containing protein [Lachnospiraceae bacterium]